MERRSLGSLLKQLPAAERRPNPCPCRANLTLMWAVRLCVPDAGSRDKLADVPDRGGWSLRLIWPTFLCVCIYHVPVSVCASVVVSG